MRARCARRQISLARRQDDQGCPGPAGRTALFVSRSGEFRQHYRSRCRYSACGLRLHRRAVRVQDRQLVRATARGDRRPGRRDVEQSLLHTSAGGAGRFRNLSTSGNARHRPQRQSEKCPRTRRRVRRASRRRPRHGRGGDVPRHQQKMCRSGQASTRNRHLPRPADRHPHAVERPRRSDDGRFRRRRLYSEAVPERFGKRLCDPDRLQSRAWDQQVDAGTAASRIRCDAHPAGRRHRKAADGQIRCRPRIAAARRDIHQIAGRIALPPNRNPPMPIEILTYLGSRFLLDGAVLAIEIAAVSMVFGLALGLGLALMRLSRHATLSGPAWCYIWFIRGTPLLLQLVFIYDVLPAVGIKLDTFATAVIGFSLNEAAFSAEIIRGGILSVNRSQLIAAAALGMSGLLTFRRIILPQAMRVILPGLANQAISMIKSTSIASVILVNELTFRAEQIVGQNFKFFTVFTAAALIYLAMTSCVAVGQIAAERRFDFLRDPGGDRLVQLATKLGLGGKNQFERHSRWCR